MSALGGCSDTEILAACRKEDRVLVTLDLDFADIRFSEPTNHSGLWVLRPFTQSIGNTLGLLRGALEVFQQQSPANQLWIVEPGRVRIRQ